MNRDNSDSQLTDAELAFLKELGLATPPTPGWDPLAAGLRVRHALLATALSETEVAEMLGTTTKDIKDRIEQSELLATKEDDCWLLPRFQFHDNQYIEGFSILARHLEPDEDLFWFYQWFTLPSFDIDPVQPEKAISPKEWLISGGLVERPILLYEMSEG